MGSYLLPLMIALFAIGMAGVLVLLFWKGSPMHRSDRSTPVAPFDVQASHKMLEGRDPEYSMAVEVINLLPDPVVYVDKDTRILAGNPAAHSLAKLVSDSYMIEWLKDYELDQIVRQATSSGTDTRAKVRIAAPQITVEVLVRPIQHSGSVVLLRDVTRIEYLERIRRDLVANISHDLRTPLATMQVLVDTLVGGAAKDPGVRDTFMSQLRDQIAHLSRIVEQSLELTKLESVNNLVSSAPFKAQDLVDRALVVIGPRAKRAGITITRSIPDDLPDVLVDHDLTSRVLINLLDNAVKWTSQGGRIHISASQQNDQVLIAVEDTGPGIAPDELPRLFERFYVGDQARSRGGAGLGLAIAKHAVLIQGGKIWAESPLGKGALFKFTVPVYFSEKTSSGDSNHS